MADEKETIDLAGNDKKKNNNFAALYSPWLNVVSKDKLG